MIYIVDNISNMILSRIDAWAQGAYDNAYNYIASIGKMAISEDITLNGDMVIKVE